MSGLVVTLTPGEWGDVLRGLKELLNVPGISDDRRAEITRLGKNVRAQVDACQSPEDAKGRDYDWQSVDCPDCSGVGRTPVVVDDVERWAICCSCNGRRKKTA